jgi:hypothetical protein
MAGTAAMRTSPAIEAAPRRTCVGAALSPAAQAPLRYAVRVESTARSASGQPNRNSPAMMLRKKSGSAPPVGVVRET